MIFIIAGVLAGLVIPWLDDWNRDLGTLFLSLLGGILGFLVGVLLASGIGWFPSQHREPLKRHELVALKDNVGTQGQFFLGSGHVDSEIKYFYYKRNSDGSFQAENVDSDDAKIFEDTQDKPYLQTYGSDFNHKAWWVIGVPSKTQRGEFHIPKGSILRDYSLDLN